MAGRKFADALEDSGSSQPDPSGFRDFADALEKKTKEHHDATLGMEADEMRPSPAPGFRPSG
jgi:hypothetical protein